MGGTLKPLDMDRQILRSSADPPGSMADTLGQQVAQSFAMGDLVDQHREARRRCPRRRSTPCASSVVSSPCTWQSMANEIMAPVEMVSSPNSLQSQVVHGHIHVLVHHIRREHTNRLVFRAAMFGVRYSPPPHARAGTGHRAAGVTARSSSRNICSCCSGRQRRALAPPVDCQFLVGQSPPSSFAATSPTVPNSGAR